MPNSTATHYLITSSGGSSITNTVSGFQFSFSPLARIGPTTSPQVINDADNSGTASAGDFFAASAQTYTGYTITLNGQEYAIFNGLVAGNYVIPHNGELNPLVIVSPQPVTANPSANVANCFAQGTLIATPEGERAVEAMQIGDLISTTDGRIVPVKWIGRQSVSKMTGSAQLEPVCIQAGALGDGQPSRDLTITADHGMIIDGLLVNASALVNGDTINFVPLSELPDRMTYYHIETEAHDTIIANGAQSETFVDVLGRTGFDNFEEYLALYVVERIIPEMQKSRITSQRTLPDHIKTRLGIDLMDTPDLEILLG